MASIKGLVTQSGADTATELKLATGLTINGKAGWEIKGLRTMMATKPARNVGGYLISMTLQTETGAQYFDDDDTILITTYEVLGPAVMTATTIFQPMQTQELILPRITVQPELVLRLASAATSVANSCYFELFYDVVSLSDLEVVQLYQGGA